jgi:hypothetical protein
MRVFRRSQVVGEEVAPPHTPPSARVTSPGATELLRRTSDRSSWLWTDALPGGTLSNGPLRRRQRGNARSESCIALTRTQCHGTSLGLSAQINGTLTARMWVHSSSVRRLIEPTPCLPLCQSKHTCCWAHPPPLYYRPQAKTRSSSWDEVAHLGRGRSLSTSVSGQVARRGQTPRCGRRTVRRNDVRAFRRKSSGRLRPHRSANSRARLRLSGRPTSRRGRDHCTSVGSRRLYPSRCVCVRCTCRMSRRLPGCRCIATIRCRSSWPSPCGRVGRSCFGGARVTCTWTSTARVVQVCGYRPSLGSKSSSNCGGQINDAVSTIGQLE